MSSVINNTIGINPYLAYTKNKLAFATSIESCMKKLGFFFISMLVWDYAIL